MRAQRRFGFILFYSIATLATSCFLSSDRAIAGPVLVVDVDDGSMAIHVGVTGPLSKPVLGQSGGDGGSSLIAGDWGPMTSLSITSFGSSLHNNGGPNPDVLQLVLGSTVQNYSEGTFSGAVTVQETTIIPLTATYNNIVDARDLDFISVNSGQGSDWNTIYIGSIPEPGSLLLMGISLMGLVAGHRCRLR